MGANGRRSETIPGAVTAHAAISYGDLLTATLPDARPLVHGLIEEQTGNILAGPPSVGKTWMVLSIARAVASGSDWLGHFPTTQSPVLMIDEESHLPGLQARARMLEAGDPLGNDLPIHFAIGHGIRVDANPGHAHLAALMEAHRPGLTILDSLTRVHGADENSAGQMADVFANTKMLMRQYETAVLFTDHIRKKSLLNDPEEMLRGSTEKRAWPECILFASPGEGNKITVTHVKARYTERLADFSVEVRIDKAEGTAVVVHTGAATSSSVTKANEIILAIHALKAEMGEDGADAVRVAAWLECHPDTVRRHVTKLSAAGIVAVRKAVAGARGGQPRDVYDVLGGRD